MPSTKRAANPPARSRTRKKAGAPASSPATPADGAPEAEASEASADARNVNSFEGAASLVLGVLFVVAALFPRSLKQWLMLSLGGGLVYRGMTGHCAVYQTLGIDTAKEPPSQPGGEPRS